MYSSRFFMLDTLVGYHCGVVWSFPSLVNSYSCVIIGMIFSLLFTLLLGVLICTWYIFFTIAVCSSWSIYFDILDTITGSTLRFGFSISTIVRIVWFFLSSCYIASDCLVPMFSNGVGGIGFLITNVSYNSDLDALSVEYKTAWELL